ncbi:hypothetical protein CHL67_11550 [Prosthecochloris sp. GSB1]|uniref:ImmA/IrrE family metallo-endopeptidase n=1 Tax=Prosthecochloris sp. GSB1 TaxID=281093 RepID=UPI000B8C80F1|nr:hypothetical protein [Prosthecochloris sp. GSB1]ASQ91473.1 hypothetical protein CHL67_11550 [Prosthecochloris sp. GSB1]
MTNLEELLKTLTQPLYPFSGSKNATLKERFDQKLIDLNISQHQALKLLNIERKSLVSILDQESKRIDMVNALKLSNFLNLTPKDFIDIYLTEMSSEAIGELEKARKRTFIVNNFDINKLYSIKFIESKNDFDIIENKILKFFGFDSIYEYEDEKHFPLYSRTKRSSNDKMREFWIKSGHQLLEKINNPNEYSRNNLVDLAPKIKPYTNDISKGLYTVAKALYNIGITVIYQPHLPSVQVRGATIIVNNKPCIILTDVWNKYPTLWFTLIHEIYHILYDLDDIKTITYHISDDYDLFLSEEQANQFAKDYLFSEEKHNYILPFIDNHLVLKEFAKKSNIHPSIIYASHCYEQQKKGNSKSWMKYSKHIPNSKEAIKYFNTNPWKKENIDESVLSIKESLYNT